MNLHVTHRGSDVNPSTAQKTTIRFSHAEWRPNIEKGGQITHHDVLINLTVDPVILMSCWAQICPNLIDFDNGMPHACLQLAADHRGQEQAPSTAQKIGRSPPTRPPKMGRSFATLIMIIRMMIPWFKKQSDRISINAKLPAWQFSQFQMMWVENRTI